MSDTKGYYSTLEVKLDDTIDVIKRQYRKKAFLTHPDKDPSGTAKFHKINEAYEVLSDPDKRREYDLLGNHFKTEEINVNPEDIFEFIRSIPSFGEQANFIHINRAVNTPSYPVLQRPTPIIKTIKISLSQAYIGCKIPVAIERWICEGKLKQQERETIYVTVPEGIDDNEIIVLKGKGNVLNDNNKGDVKIFVKVVNETEFKRRGLELVFHKVITLKESLCGFTFDMEYLDERTFKIDNHNGNVISPGFKKLIPGLGMTRDGHKGNLIIEFTVIFPDKLTPEQIDNIKDHL